MGGTTRFPVARLNETFRVLHIAALGAMWIVLGTLLANWLRGANVPAPAVLVIFVVLAAGWTWLTVTAPHRLEVDIASGTLVATSLVGRRTVAVADVVGFEIIMLFLRGFAVLRTRQGSHVVYAHLDGLSAVLEAIRDGGGSLHTTAI